MFKIYHVLYYLLVIIYIEFKINHCMPYNVWSTYCMLIHEHDIFYIDFIMIKLVSLESLLNYIIQFILCFF